MSKKRPKNDVVWEQILHEKKEIYADIESVGFSDITADEIKDISGREPRLATYFPFKEKLPKALKDESLSVLAIENGKYRLAKTDPFMDLGETESPSSKVETFQLPNHIDTLIPGQISGESKALDAALISGMLDHVFQDKVSLVLRGRERSSPFRFRLPDVGGARSIEYPVDGVTIEIDGGYEGYEGLYFVEAKNEEPKTLNLRQVLYPELSYLAKFPQQKRVTSWILRLSHQANSSLYHFSKCPPFYRSRNELADDFHITQTITCKLIDTDQKEVDYWGELWKVGIDHNQTDNSRPFPQADDFRKVVNLFLTLADRGLCPEEELFSEYPIVPRQYDYYGNALRWLRVARKETGSKVYEITALGRDLHQYSKLTGSPPSFELAKIVLSNDIFFKALHHDGVDSISKADRQRNRLPEPNISTYSRRLVTVKAWLREIKKIFDK